MTGNRLTRLVAIGSRGMMLLVKTRLDHVSNFSIGYYFVRGLYVVLVDFIFFRVCFMCTFSRPLKEVGASLDPLLGWAMW